MIQVAIVDDHRVVIDGIEKIVTESGVAVLMGKAYTVAGCWKMLAAGQPDVLLLDVGLPDGNGVELCPKIKAKYPAVNILMLTSYAEYTIISDVLSNGVLGYMVKNAMPEEIIEGICTVASGKQFLSKDVDLLLKTSEKNRLILTRREQELLRLITDGHSNIEIADKMCLGYETIKSYRKNLFIKLEVHNTVDLTKKAIEQKLR